MKWPYINIVVVSLFLLLPESCFATINVDVYDPYWAINAQATRIQQQNLQDSLNSNLQNLQNSINGVTSAIDAQTQAIKNSQTQQENALIQQRLDALDQSCVNQIFAYINSKDTALKEYNKRIADGTAKRDAAGSGSADFGAWQNYINTAYIYKQAQILSYENFVINICSKSYEDQSCRASYGDNSVWNGKVSTTASAVGGLCTCTSGYAFNSQQTQCLPATTPITSNNLTEQQIQSISTLLHSFGASQTIVSAAEVVIRGGKAANAGISTLDQGQINAILSLLYSFGAGQETINSVGMVLRGDTVTNRSGDTVAKLPMNQDIAVNTSVTKQPVASVPHPKEVSPAIHKVAATATPKVSSTTENKIPAGKDNKATTTPPSHQGIFQKSWSWFKGLFGF